MTVLRRLPRAAWVCALVGVLNATAWSLLIPAFQVPDEIAHYAYSEHIAQTGRPPAERTPDLNRLELSRDEEVVSELLHFPRVARRPENAGPWTRLEQRRLARTEDAGLSRESAAYSYGATPQPPLYYALAAIPYRVADGGTLLDRLALMRLLSAFLGGLTVLLSFLFLREALPGAPWTWTVGALGAALQPMFAFATGGVNPDALLFTTSAALFLCLARAFRHGLTTRLAIATGAVVAVGLLGKLNILGLLPGAAVGIVLAAARREGGLRAATLRLPAIALGVAAAPVLIGMALNLAWDRPAIGLLGSNSGALSHGSLGGQLSYLWQFYLPRLPGMDPIFPFQIPREWFGDFTGNFGWLETTFPAAVRNGSLGIFGLVIALCARTLVGAREQLGGRRAELLVYALMTLGLLLLVAVQSYAVDIAAESTASAFQVRYLLPLLPLYAALLALAARGAGRLLPVAGVGIVMLALAHDVFAQLLVVGRFYA